MAEIRVLLLPDSRNQNFHASITDSTALRYLKCLAKCLSVLVLNHFLALIPEVPGWLLWLTCFSYNESPHICMVLYNVCLCSPFIMWVLGNWTHIISLGSKHPHPQSHLTAPVNYFHFSQSANTQIFPVPFQINFTSSFFGLHVFWKSCPGTHL